MDEDSLRGKEERPGKILGQKLIWRLREPDVNRWKRASISFHGGTLSSIGKKRKETLREAEEAVMRWVCWAIAGERRWTRWHLRER